MITYTHSLKDISAGQLQGFFVGWPNPPGPARHLELLEGSSEAILAMDQQTGQVIGFITAISDRVLSAYVPFLEVLPPYRHQGIGRELTRRMLERLQDLYMVDLICDLELQSFYARFAMQPAPGMILRNYDKQSGA